jgi:hypothetical protein
MRINLKHIIPIKEFRHYTPQQLKEKARDQLIREALEITLKHQVVWMQENERDTTFHLQMIMFTPHQWQGIVSALKDIKVALDNQRDLREFLVRLCDNLRV